MMLARYLVSTAHGIVTLGGFLNELKRFNDGESVTIRIYFSENPETFIVGKFNDLQTLLVSPGCTIELEHNK